MISGVLLKRLTQDHEFKPFDCGNQDLNDFLLKDTNIIIAIIVIILIIFIKILLISYSFLVIKPLNIVSFVKFLKAFDVNGTR